MVFAEGMKKEIQKRNENIAEYLLRLKRAQLSSLNNNHYSDSGSHYLPKTKEAWQLHEKLLDFEGALTPEGRSEITSALINIELEESINRKMNEIIQELGEHGTLPSIIENGKNLSKEYLTGNHGRQELKLIAMKILGLNDLADFKKLYDLLAANKTEERMSLAGLYQSRPID